LTAFSAAQLVGPSSAPSAGPATSYKALPAVWLRLAVNLGAGGNVDRHFRTTTIELTLPAEKGERVLSAIRIASLSDLESATQSGRLTFRDIPTQLPMWLRIAVHAEDDAVLSSYARSYVLHFPERSRATQIGVPRALEESGYLGDFVIDAINAEITRTVTSQ
jgi:hypothetical protein